MYNKYPYEVHFTPTLLSTSNDATQMSSFSAKLNRKGKNMKEAELESFTASIETGLCFKRTELMSLRNEDTQ